MKNRIKLVYITGDCEIAEFALNCGADRILVDMESCGKSERQQGKFQNPHSMQDFINIRRTLPEAFVSVRINPMTCPQTVRDIETIVRSGADQIIVPYFQTLHEVRKFIRLTPPEINRCALVETKKSLGFINELIKLQINEFYLGFHDLSLDFRLDFIFKVLSQHKTDQAIEALQKSNSFFGFGGLAPMEKGLVKGRDVLGELLHRRASMVFLSRDFHHCAGSLQELKQKIDLQNEISILRTYEGSLLQRSPIQEKSDMEKIYNQINRINE